MLSHALLQAEQKKWAAKEASLRDASQGIQGFEANLRRLGLDAEAEADADPIIPTQGTSPQDTMRKILCKVPPTGTIEQARGFLPCFCASFKCAARYPFPQLTTCILSLFL